MDNAPLYAMRLGRYKNGLPQQPSAMPDTQVEAVLRDVKKFLDAHRPTSGPIVVWDADSTQPAPDNAVMQGELAQYLQAGWPGATAEAVSEYYWHVLPSGQRVWVCIEGQVTVTQEKTASSGTEAPTLKPVEPPILIKVEWIMP